MFLHMLPCYMGISRWSAWYRPRLYFIVRKFISYQTKSNRNYRNYGNWKESLLLWQAFPSERNVKFGFKRTEKRNSVSSTWCNDRDQYHRLVVGWAVCVSRLCSKSPEVVGLWPNASTTNSGALYTKYVQFSTVPHAFLRALPVELWHTQVPCLLNYL